MSTNAKVWLEDCGPHGSGLGRTPPIRFTQTRIGSEGLTQIKNYEFEDCDFSSSKLDGRSFSDCLFLDCTFRSTDMHCTYFWNCRFINCEFSDASWVHVGFRDVTFRGCTFLGIELETGMFTTCTFSNVAWNGGSMMCSYVNYTVFDATSFMEAG